MSKFYKIRLICWIIGLVSSLMCVAFMAFNIRQGVYVSIIILLVDLVIIAVKNRCPFCHHALRTKPMKEEFCPYCGDKIK